MLNRELLKYDLNNIEYDTFQEIIVSLAIMQVMCKQIMQVLWQRNLEKILCKEQDLELSTSNNELNQLGLHIISKEINVLAF